MGYVIGLASKSRELFIKIFIISYSIIAALQLMVFLISPLLLGHYLLITPYNGWRLRGFLENPNAYGFLGVCVTAFQFSYYRLPLLSPVIKRVCLILSTLAIFFTGSKSAMLSYMIFLLFFLSFKAISLRVIKWVGVSLIAVIVLIMSSAYFGKFMEDNSSTFYHHFEHNLKGTYFYSIGEVNKGVLERLHVNKLACESWVKSPFFGNGLGSFIETQKGENTLEPMTIHNTYLWILSEMGLVGFSIFLILPLMIFCSAWTQFKTSVANHHTALATIGLLVASAVGSLFNEFLYQRHLWLFLGIYVGSCQVLSVIKQE